MVVLVLRAERKILAEWLQQSKGATEGRSAMGRLCSYVRLSTMASYCIALAPKMCAALFQSKRPLHLAGATLFSQEISINTQARVPTLAESGSKPVISTLSGISFHTFGTIRLFWRSIQWELPRAFDFSLSFLGNQWITSDAFSTWSRQEIPCFFNISHHHA
jgi:hypothetical protein